VSTSATAEPVDHAALDRQIDAVCRLMSAHAGAIELLDVSVHGAVRVRFTGMCTGCPFRPLTMRGTIGPALSEVPGVTAVHADGARISEEAAERLELYLGASASPLAAIGTVAGIAPSANQSLP
jgi:Fe-S cluster biogenesis protein NfuA